jgi:regulator of cell morphogenesis and NO signaling
MLAPTNLPPSSAGGSEAAVVAANDEASHDLTALTDHIVERFHRVHLRDLPIAIDLAREVEQRFSGHVDCPVGLADHLGVLARNLEAHQWREEATLFPIIRIGTPFCLAFVARRMMEDHVAVDVHLMALKRFTAALRPSLDAPLCWHALTFMCRKLEADLRAHAQLEHEMLYDLLLAQARR